MDSHARTASSIQPTRRTLVRSAAWSVPAVAVAATAPAFAASYCPTVTLNWADYTAGSVFTSGTVGGVTVTLSVTGGTAAANNRTISNVATGAQANNLRFYSERFSSSQTATFSFSRGGQPLNVINLNFAFLDIDSGNTWADRVSVGTSGFSPTIVNPTYVIGAGATTGSTSTTGPFRAANANTSPDTQGTSPNGNVTVSWAAAVSSVSFTYSQGVTPGASSAPFIGISSMSFQPNC